MPYYNDVPYYYGGGSYANHSSLMTGTGRTPFHTTLSRFSPHLSTISESPFSHLHRFSPIAVRHPRRVIDTADIDVSTPRIISQDGNRPRNRLRRNRPTIKIRSQALKDNPALRQHNERHEKSVGELLMEKFFIKDKKSDGDEGQQIRLYHQVSLDHLEDPQEREALQRRVTRRFTRRRSSADLQLDPEQLQREVAYAQVQAKVLDSLVAEEQAQIENETRRGTLIKKGTTGPRGPMHSYYSANSADSDTMTHEEEEAAAARIRKTMKKAKKKKKHSVDRLMLNERIDNRRSSTSSEVSTDSKIEDENDVSKPQMYKIEACNSAGDFSTIWVNASPENEKRKPTYEQFRESVKIPVPGRSVKENERDAPTSSTDEAETQIVLPVRKSYVKDSSRNSVYLTMRKPTEKLDEKLKKLEAFDAKNDGDRSGLENGFVDAGNADIFENNAPRESTGLRDSSELNGEIQTTNDIKDAALKKIVGRSKKNEFPMKKKDVHSALNDEKSREPDIVVPKTRSDVPEAATDDAPSSSVETVANSASLNVPALNSINSQKNNAEMKQLVPSKDILAKVPSKDILAKVPSKDILAKVPSKDILAKEPSKDILAKVPSKDILAKVSSKDILAKVPSKDILAKEPSKDILAKVSSKDILAKDVQKDEVANNDDSIYVRTRSLDYPDATVAVVTPGPLATKESTSWETDKSVVKEDKPKIPTMSRETSTRRNVTAIEVDDNARENSASGATFTPSGTACRLPKPSKINTDRNNAVEASELSLRGTAEYLADSQKSAEDVAGTVAVLPGKKVNKASNLAKVSTTVVETRGANGVVAIRNDDAAKSMTKGTTLLKETNGEVFNDDRDGKATDAVVIKDTGAIITPDSDAGKTDENVSRELFLETTGPKIEAEVITGTAADASREEGPSKTDDAKKIAGADVGKDSPKSLLGPKVPKLNNAESKFPFKVKTFARTAGNESGGAEPPKIGKDSGTFKLTKVDNVKSISSPKRDVDALKALKKSVSVDSSKSTNDQSPNLTSSNIPKVLQQSVSVDGKIKNANTPVKKTAKPMKSANKVMEEKPIDAERDKSQEERGQLSKSASTESIDFWSEITASRDPEVTRSKQQQQQNGLLSRGATPVAPKIEEKADPVDPKRALSDSPASEERSSTVSVKESDDKKNETDVKISVPALGGPTVESSEPAVEEEKRRRETTVPESPAVRKAEVAGSAKTTEVEGSASTVARKAPPKKKKNLTVTIGATKDATSSTVKKAPLKREDSANSIQSDLSTPGTATPVTSETPTPVVTEVTIPVINIVEASPKSPEESDGRRIDEEHEEPVTPTNELPPDPSFIKKISRWNNQNDLTNVDDVETPVASEETSLTASPSVSPPQSSKAKCKKKKTSTKKTLLAKLEKGKEARSNESTLTTGQQNAFNKTERQNPPVKPSPKTSPKSSPKNAPSQRPLDLIRMFYTTPSALLTATPRDLSKVRRAKIKRRRHHSRTPSVSSDSTGSTTSTATTGSTDGSTCTEVDDEEHKRMNSTRSNDSGFDGSPRISNCDMTCHKKCEKLTGNLCGLNQKLVAEALQSLKKAPSQSSDNQRNSDSSDHFPSGRITPPATNLPRFKKYVVTDFNFLKVLGKGSFGKVLLAELRDTECVYAVKCLKKDVVLEDDDVECTLIERKVLTLATRHPYLCHLFCTFQTDSHLFFVMEYLNGGDLMFHIQKSGRFPEVRARFYAAEIWSGLNFLHKKGIVYRDLKLDNVLLDYEGHIRIADFGMCKLQIFLDRTADTFCGTPDYMAPEIIKGLKYNQAVDWWSYGILLYEMLTGQSPFSGCDEDELFWSICNERPFIPRYLSQEATDILVCLLEKDAGKRLPGHEIAMHAFFQHLPWDRLERRQLEAPFKPALDHTLDTKYFDTAFTTERPRLTPVPEQILISMDQGVFRGFSYTNPNATD